MKLLTITVECDCGARIQAAAYDYHGDMLKETSCPNCKRQITASLIPKKDGFALFLKRTKHTPYRSHHWKEVEPK